MIKKIILNNLSSEYIYTGAFDLNNDNKIIHLNVGEEIIVDLNKAIGSTKEAFRELTTEEISEVCNLSNVKATIYPNGNISFYKMIDNGELNSCYISIIQGTSAKYLLCIVFGETQPMLYKAQLLDVFKFESAY